MLGDGSAKSMNYTQKNFLQVLLRLGRKEGRRKERHRVREGEGEKEGREGRKEGRCVFLLAKVHSTCEKGNTENMKIRVSTVWGVGISKSYNGNTKEIS